MKINCSNVVFKDKSCHFIAGFIISVVFGFLLTPEVGLYSGVVAGALKEVYDKYSKTGVADIYDAAATFVGSFVAFVLITYFQF